MTTPIGVGWSSRATPMVGPDGRVPPQIAVLIGATNADRCIMLRDFLEEVCRDLADARAQVVADRAELDRLRNLHHPRHDEAA